MKGLKYIFVYIIPIVVYYSLCNTGFWSFSALIVAFGIIPILELFSKENTSNYTEEQEVDLLKNKWFDWILYSLVPIQLVTLGLFLTNISNGDFSTITIIGWTTAMGISCGVLGINAAHELGHRSTKYEQFMSKLLLLTTLYTHFFIEHNRGHHNKVATAEDPASSRFGETVYKFYIRSIKDSWLSAWQLEAKRLSKLGIKNFSSKNEMLMFQIIQVIWLAIILICFGKLAFGMYLIAAFIGILLLETVNYIEHYGLVRNKKGEKYERTHPEHSWNSNHPIGRILLLELSRHSDHHYIASRKYQILRHFDQSPQMPTGYPGMMLLALVPPLWFRVMHKQIFDYKRDIHILKS